MDPFWLTFHNAHLEHHYDRFVFYRRLQYLDVLYSMAGMVGHTVFAVKHSRFCPPSVRLGLALHFASIVMFLSLRLSNGLAWIESRRNYLVLTIRLFRAVPNVLVFPNLPCRLWSIDKPGWLGFVRTLTTQGFLVHAYSSLVLVLKFRYHLLSQIPNVILLIYAKVPNFCVCIMASSGRDEFLHYEKTVGVAMHYISMIVHAPFGGNVWSKPPKEECFQLACFLHLFFGILVIEVGVWIRERRWRLEYLQHHNVVFDDNMFPDIAGQFPLSLDAMFLLVVMMVVFWEDLDWLPTLLKMLR